MSLAAIGIVADNPAKSVAFYALLGIELKKMGDSEHYDGTSGGVRVMLDSIAVIKSFDPSYVKPGASGVVMCFKQATGAGVDALYAKVTAAGFTGKKAPWDAFWGQRYACVLDPDGNQIDLFADI